MAIAKTPRWAVRLNKLTDTELRELYDSQGDPNSWESFKQEVRGADGILGKFYADKRTMTLIGDDWLTRRLDNHIELHPDNKNWANFLKGTELREEKNGWKHYISSNGHYIVSPTGEVKVFYGYHGQNAFDKLSQRGLAGKTKSAKLAKGTPSGLSVKKAKGGYEVIHTKSGNRLMPFTYPEKELATDFAQRAGQVGVDWTRPFSDLQKESEKIADLIRGGKKPGMFEKVLDMPTTFPKEKRMRQNLDTTKVGRVTSQLSYVPGLPFQGREHTVIIDELAKAGWRFIGDSRDKKPDAFLIKAYGLKDVHRATLPLTSGGSYTVWIGRPTNDAGEKELLRLSSDKLPWVPQETLPDSVARGYVMSREATEKEKADRQRADDERRTATGRESAKSLSEEKLREILATAKDTLKRKYISDYDKRMKPMEIEIVLAELQRRGLSERLSRKKKVDVAETSLQSIHDSRSASEPAVRRDGNKWNVYDPDYKHYGEVLASFDTEKAADDYARLLMVHDSRSPRSRESDERQSNADTIEPDDSRVEQWVKDQGRMDVVGVDTPRKSKGKKVARKTRESTRTETQVRGLRK